MEPHCPAHCLHHKGWKPCCGISWRPQAQICPCFCHRKTSLRSILFSDVTLSTERLKSVKTDLGKMVSQFHVENKQPLSENRRFKSFQTSPVPPGTEMGQKDLVGSTSAKLRKELEWQVEEISEFYEYKLHRHQQVPCLEDIRHLKVCLQKLMKRIEEKERDIIKGCIQMGLQNLQGQSQHNLQGTWTTALEVSPELTPVHWYPSCIGGKKGNIGRKRTSHTTGQHLKGHEDKNKPLRRAAQELRTNWVKTFKAIAESNRSLGSRKQPTRREGGQLHKLSHSEDIHGERDPEINDWLPKKNIFMS
eukprot:XP_021130965.1 uncharacterized protein LOC106018394 isoform X2 [Anas platyrhynchos]